MAKMTPAEKKWIKQLEAVLAKCPSKRMEAYTIGDNDITIYDKPSADAEEAKQTSSMYGERDYHCYVADADAELCRLTMLFGVQSLAG
jgi:hypothetical protein